MLPQLSMSCLKLECVLPKLSGIMKQVKLLASCQHYTACRVDKQCAKCTIGSSVQAGEQGVYRECANVYKLYTSSVTNLDTVLGY